MTLATRLRATSKDSLSCRDWSGQAVEINRANLPGSVRSARHADDRDVA